MRRIVLASASPRRKMLLEHMKIPFEIIVSGYEEKGLELVKSNKPEEIAKSLSLYKARDVLPKVRDALVIGADTIVVYNGEILGKPVDERDAESMLKKLSGATHEVITALAIIDSRNGKELVDYEKTRVTMKELSDEEIRNYIATGEPMDKAGAYGIQGRAGAFVTGVGGCYNNVVGLPVNMLVKMLREFGVNAQ